MIRHITPPPHEIIENCGWTDYYRYRPQDYDSLNNLLLKNSKRTERVIDYVSQVLNSPKSVVVPEVMPADMRAIKLPQYMAGVALKTFGIEKTSILNIRKATLSEDCTNYVINKLEHLKPDSNHLVTIDARNNQTKQPEADRRQAIVEAVNDIDTHYVYFALLGEVEAPVLVPNIASLELSALEIKTAA